MKRRGPYSKGVARREEILTGALKVIARDGYTAATVQLLADEVGISKTALLHYFGSKEVLLREVLRRRDAEQVAAFDPAREDFRYAVVRQVLRDSIEPGLAQLHTRLGAEAIDPDHAAHTYFHERYRIIFDVGVNQLQQLRARGTISTDVDLGDLSLLLTAVLDGLQLRRQYDHDLDLARALSSFWALVGPSTLVGPEDELGSEAVHPAQPAESGGGSPRIQDEAERGG